MRETPAETRCPGFRPGDEPIPGFRLVRRRGRGGFGEVWEAEAPGGIHVALKFVHCSPRAQAAELRALNCVLGIHHPNLLANFGSWQAEGTLVVGMELADGSLWDRYVEVANIGLWGIPRAELLGYMADAAAGLDYLNEPRHTIDGRAGVGILHRDVKPPNILLFGGGAKVADLGMARAMEGQQGAHTGIWTFPYAAPEFFRGMATRQSDQYGLAATYCQLRCGRLPFEGNAAAVTAGHLYGQPDLEGLPEAERPILERALSKEPGDRWPDCRALVEALRAPDPDGAPELLHRPDDPIEDIPRMFRSSTGALAISPATPGDLDDVPAPSWHPFDTTSSREFLALTAPTPAPSPIPSGPTAIRSADDHGPEAAPTDRRRPGRIGRYATATLVVGLAIAAAGVRPTTDQEPRPRTPPGLAGVDATGAAERPPERPRIGPDAGPGPAGAEADDAVRPASTSATQPVPPEVAPDPVDGSGTPPERPGDPPVSTPTEGDPVGEMADRSAPSTLAEVAPPPLPPPPTRGPEGPAGPATPTTEGTETRARPEIASSPAPDLAGPGTIDASAASESEARGRAHLALGEFEGAIADLDRAIRLHPGKVSSYFLRGLARHRASHYPEALADYTEVIRVRPDDPRAFIARGQAQHDLGAFDRAIADYTRAIRLRPDEPSAHYRRGLARYRSDDFAGALADFDEAIRLDPKNARAREFRDDTLARVGGRARDNHDPPTTPEAVPTNPAPARPTTRPATPQVNSTVAPRPRPAGKPPALIRVLRKVL